MAEARPGDRRSEKNRAISQILRGTGSPETTGLRSRSEVFVRVLVRLVRLPRMDEPQAPGLAITVLRAAREDLDLRKICVFRVDLSAPRTKHPLTTGHL